VHLDRALQRWNKADGQHNESLAIDGKTMCNAIDDQGYQIHIVSVVGHQTKRLSAPTKSRPPSRYWMPSIAIRLITAASKSAKYGPQPNLTVI
jgi:hypothetical protein